MPSLLAGGISHASWARAFLKRSNHPASWWLGEEGFPCPAGCCRITLVPALKPARTSPTSHRSPSSSPFRWSPSSGDLNLRQHLAIPPSFAGNRTCAQQLPPAGCRRPRARWDNGGSSPPGSLQAFAAQHSHARSWRKSEALVRENLGNGKGKKKSWDLASSYTSFHEKSNVAIASPRLCWSTPRPLPGPAALPMPTQLSAEPQPNLVPCPRLRRLREPLLPPPPAGGDGSQTPREPPASRCSCDIFIAIGIVFNFLCFRISDGAIKKA